MRNFAVLCGKIDQSLAPPPSSNSGSAPATGYDLDRMPIRLSWHFPVLAIELGTTHTMYCDVIGSNYSSPFYDFFGKCLDKRPKWGRYSILKRKLENNETTDKHKV